MPASHHHHHQAMLSSTHDYQYRWEAEPGSIGALYHGIHTTCSIEGGQGIVNITGRYFITIQSLASTDTPVIYFTIACTMQDNSVVRREGRIDIARAGQYLPSTQVG